jgi:hypothetical protein
MWHKLLLKMFTIHKINVTSAKWQKKKGWLVALDKDDD